MLEMLLDKKLLFVLMGMLTGLGVADKCIVSITMKWCGIKNVDILFSRIS